MSEARISSWRPGAVWVIGTSLFVTATSAPALPAQQSQRYEVAGADVAVYNLAGTVRIEPGSGSAVVVEITRQGPDADQLRVETGPIDDRSTLRVIYPSGDIVYRFDGGSRETELRVREDGTFGDSDWRDRRRGDRVRISDRGGGLEASADLRILVPQSQRFAIYLAAGDVSANDVDGTLRIDTHNAQVSTSGTSGSLVVDTGSGSVEVTGAEGDVLVDTGSGRVDVTRVRGDALLVDTGSGGVTVADANVSDLNVDTGSGRIEVSGTSARDVLLDTGSGSVNLELTNAAERVVIDTGSGAVMVTVPTSFSAEVEIDTGSGGIDVDFPLQVRKWERSYVAGTIGDGGGRLHIDTGSGSVTLRRGG
jgi:DUF4097 and DUF4098 domain-containing protein YvlB